MEDFLNYLVTNRRLSASSQSQALNALMFLYRKVLDIEPGWLENLERVKRKHFLPTVLTVNEVREILNQMRGMPRLMAKLIYGTGMRIKTLPPSPSHVHTDRHVLSYAYSHLSFTDGDIAREYARHYHRLRAFMAEHPEVGAILGATD